MLVMSQRKLNREYTYGEWIAMRQPGKVFLRHSGDDGFWFYVTLEQGELVFSHPVIKHFLPDVPAYLHDFLFTFFA